MSDPMPAILDTLHGAAAIHKAEIAQDRRTAWVDLFEAHAETHDDKYWIPVETAADLVVDQDAEVEWEDPTGYTGFWTESRKAHFRQTGCDGTDCGFMHPETEPWTDGQSAEVPEMFPGTLAALDHLSIHAQDEGLS